MIRMTTAILLYSIAHFLKKNKATQIKKIREIERNSYQIIFHTQKGNIPVIYNYEKELFLPTLLKLKTVNKDGWFKKVRKFIENCTILDIQIPNFERIIKIECKKHEEYNLIIELFGGGNTILTSKENKIVAIQREIAVRHRVLKEGEEYVLPPPRGENPFKVDSSMIKKVTSFRNLFSLLNIDKYTIKEALSRLRVTPETELSGNTIKKVIKEIIRLVKIAGEGVEGYSIIKNDKGRLEILPYKSTYTSPIRMFKDLLDASTFFIENTLLKQVNINILREKEKISRRIDSIRNNIKKLQWEISLLEEWIPTLYQKTSELEELFKKVKKEEVKNYEIDYNKKIILIPLTDFFSIPLRFDMNVFQSIGYLYDKEYKRRKKGLITMKKKLQKLLDELKKLDEKSVVKISPRKKRVLKEKKWFEKFRWFITSKGNLVIGGRDSNTNEALVKKYLEKNDLVFHSDFYGSPFVILKKGKDADDIEIHESAIFTASYSRAWREKIYTLDVYYVYPDQISKKTPSGEYLKKGSFMIYGKKNFVRKVPLELWIGIRKDKKDIFVGPPTAVRTHCIEKGLFEIRPGDSRKKEIAEFILRTLKDKDILKVSDDIIDYYIDSIIAKLPPGRSLIKIITSLEKKS